MLGAAETVGGQGELFAVVDKKHRIFAKKLVERSIYADLPIEYRAGRGPTPGPRVTSEPVPASDMQSEVNRLILDRYGPPGVVVDAQFQIIQFRGRTGDFLEPAPGDAAQSLNVLKMAREGLLHGLQAALFNARKTEAPVRKEGLRVHSGGHVREIHLQVVPLAAPGEARHYLVLFEDVRAGDDDRPPPPPPLAVDDHLSQIQDELAASREYLQSIIQDLEAANEELQSANEEILSSNEELQSTNEELDTAKEELQSTNEELNTVNEELHGRNEELSRVNSDLINLLGSVEIAIVIVGADLAIRRFTPMAEKILNLIPTDLGRPISQIKPNIDCPELERMITHVIATIEIQEQNVRDRDGNWYTLRIRPYKNVDNRIDGAVLALFNIAGRRHELELRQAHDNIAAIIETAHEPMIVLDGHLRVHFLNHAFSRRFAVARERALERQIFDLADGAWNVPQLRHLLAGLTPGRNRVEAVRLTHDFGAATPRHVRINASCIPGFEPSASFVVLAITDAEPDAGMGAGT
jgi:two-component system CheB/CheR fusion protein